MLIRGEAAVSFEADVFTLGMIRGVALDVELGDLNYGWSVRLY